MAEPAFHPALPARLSCAAAEAVAVATMEVALLVDQVVVATQGPSDQAALRARPTLVEAEEAAAALVVDLLSIQAEPAYLALSSCAIHLHLACPIQAVD